MENEVRVEAGNGGDNLQFFCLVAQAVMYGRRKRVQ
jgi:hypothetical protein